MKTNTMLIGLLFSSILLTSCTSDDDDMDKEPNVTAPSTYNFVRSGASSVSYGGQTIRIKMAEELISALKDPSNSESDLNGMFAHQEGGNDFSDASLNSSSKGIRSRTAASNNYFLTNSTESNAIKGNFDSWIKEQVDEVYPKWNNNASAGSAGNIQEAGGGSTRYVNAKGLELNQAINKSLIGALMTDQILNNYLSASILDEASNRDENDNDVLAEGKNYTTMEHKWDEAFGYLYGTDNAEAPALAADSFLSKYLSKVDDDPDFEGIAQEVYDAFKLGRAAIVAKNYTVRDEQVFIIREAISKVIAIRAVYYMQQGKINIGKDNGSAFHDLSEGYGFVYSLRFTRDPNMNQPQIPTNEISGFLDALMEGNGFWDVNSETLDEISDRIASLYGFTVGEAAS